MWPYRGKITPIYLSFGCTVHFSCEVGFGFFFNVTALKNVGVIKHLTGMLDAKYVVLSGPLSSENQYAS